MAHKTAKVAQVESETQNLTKIQRMGMWFFHRPRRTAVIWLVIGLFGVASYATLLKREGFPSINTPLAVASGTYLVNDASKVDSQVARPLGDFVLKQPGVKSVQTQSGANFYSVTIEYKEGTNATNSSDNITRAVKARNLLPAQATYKLKPIEFGFTDRGDDLVVSFYSKSRDTSTEDLIAKAKAASSFIKEQKLPLVQDVSIIDQYEAATNPFTGQKELSQQSFDRFGKRIDGEAKFYNSVIIGIKAEDKADNIELDKQVQTAVAAVNKDGQFSDYTAEISASYAPQINEQISELQKSLLEGLLAVLIIGSIVIAIRASIITVLSMVTVIAFVNGLLYLIGYSLNTITLFALILGLSLIVDDTIIMVEALDSQRRKQSDPGKAVSEATGKISKAMIAATSTSVLSFAPLLFVSGILGSFIRAIPVTIIASLLISLLVALIFIPWFARYILLGKKQMGANVHEVSAGIEAKIARFISGPMLWAKGSTRKLFLVGAIAVVIGFGFIGAGGFLFSKVTFNIFPPSKDDIQLSTNITFKPGTDISEAKVITDKVDAIVGDTIGKEFVKASYYGQADIQTAVLTVDLTNYNKRDIHSPQIVDNLNKQFEKFSEAKVEAAPLGVGPPAAAFAVQINVGNDRQAALRLAGDISSYLKHDAKLQRPDKSIAKFKSVDVANSDVYTRDDGAAYVAVNATFVDDDSSTLVTLAKDAVNKKFTKEKIAGYGLDKNAVTFDSGQEDENQDSFKTLLFAFPALLFVIYLVLSFQFRSLLQPLLIFSALPFSLFGITLGLYLTDNPFSFFAMLGFFALIGLSIKNTILLTDYANQARRSGMGVVDSAHEALAERFRPLIATSLTAVFSLIPLAISSPFWEGLSVVLIFGLLSSTFLVITVFPYYYLGAEYLRQRVNRKQGLAVVITTICLVIICSKLGIAWLALIIGMLEIVGFARRGHTQLRKVRN